MLHLPALIIDLALILGIAAIVTLLFKMLKQPVVLGYIIAGFLVGPNFHLFPTIVEPDVIKTWADIGVIFLLFTLGLEFSFKKLLKLGGVAVIMAITGVTFTMLLGFGLGTLLGWNSMNSLFLGGILAIASTTIIIRAYDELGVKNQKFAGLVTGVLVIEDLVAVLLMVLLSTMAISQSFSGFEMLLSVLKLAFFLVLWFVSGIFFLPTLLKRLNKLLSEESLLILSLALCFLMVVLATYAGFSPALGAFIMGSILAETKKAEKIEHLTQSVKNLFGAIFFVSVGMLIDPQMLVAHAVPILAATLVLLIGKPLFVTVGALVAGQPLKIAVQSGMSLSQIGEFSFIIATLGLTLKVTSDFLYPVAVAVSVISTFTTPYMIRGSETISRLIEKSLPKRWNNLLMGYSVGAQDIEELSDWKQLIRFYLFNVAIFSVIIIAIILVSTEFIAPFLAHHGIGKIITTIITLAALSPFLYALAFRRTQRKLYAHVWLNASHRGPLRVLLVSRIMLAVVYIGFLFHRLFSPSAAIIGAVVSVLLLALFSKRIKAFYGKIESRFLENYNERDAPTAKTDSLLTPWDSHIASFDLQANSPYIGKMLSEIRIREEFGVNIVSIKRGDYIINVPNFRNHLYPNDKLSVIGTDEQLKRFEKHLATNSYKTLSSDMRSGVSLFHFTVGKDSVLLLESIRSSKVRERTQGLVIGVEREGERMLNPESDLVFLFNDKVWIVGNEARIRALLKEYAG